jgi:5-methylthioadenosine/S-adenosylhomocysteine deaminase
MWAEIRTAVMLQRARTGRADALSAQTALELATTRAAAALGLDDSVGALTPGKAADLIVLDLAGSAFLPWDDPVTAAVYGGSPERVALTVVAGEIRYRRGERTPPSAAAARAKMIQAPQG